MTVKTQVGLVGHMKQERRKGRIGMAAKATRRACLIFVLTIAGGTTVVWAQAPSLPAAAMMASPSAASEAEPAPVQLLVGRSAIVDVPEGPVTRVSLTSADVADVLVTTPSQLLVNGKLPGTISMFVWNRAGSLRRYEVVVQRDLSKLSEQMKQLFPTEHIEVQTNGKNVVLAGMVSSKEAVERAVNVAAGYVEKREDVVSLLQLQAGAPSNQVLLRVRFAEVSRSALTELGATFFTSPTGVGNTIGRVTTEQFPSVGFDGIQYTKTDTSFGGAVTSAEGKFTFSDFLNLFLFSEKYDLGAMVKLLQTRGLFQSLAEPNLVSESGKEASFLAGGEFPIPIVQGGATNGITVQFKEFGIRLTFTPTVNGDRVHLKVRPEVSTLDFSNAVQIQGFRIPALSTRRTETELELQNRQTFAIAGLLNNTANTTLQKVPGIGDIPILGQLFKSKAAQKNQTELVVMITPEILPNNSNGITPSLPRTPEPFLPKLPDNKTIAPQPPPFGGVAPAGALSASAPAVPSVPAAAPITSSPAAAAAAVSALTPSGPKPAESATTGITSSSSAAPAAKPEATPRLTSQEKRALERARQQEEQRARNQAVIDRKAKAAEDKRLMEKALADRREAAKLREQQDKEAQEQARRDKEAAKRAEDAAKKQSSFDQEHQQSIGEANAKLKAAQAAYEAELARTGK